MTAPKCNVCGDCKLVLDPGPAGGFSRCRVCFGPKPQDTSELPEWAIKIAAAYRGETEHDHVVRAMAADLVAIFKIGERAGLARGLEEARAEVEPLYDACLNAYRQPSGDLPSGIYSAIEALAEKRGDIRIERGNKPKGES